MAWARARSVLLQGESSLSDWEYIEAVLSSHRPPLVGPLGGYPEFQSIYERGESSRTLDADIDRREALRAEPVVRGAERVAHWQGISIRDDHPPVRGPTTDVSRDKEKGPAAPALDESDDDDEPSL